MAFARRLKMLHVGWLAVALFGLALTPSCGDTDKACATPGEHQKCNCPGGNSSLQTCNAFNDWSPCYCDRQACGDNNQGSDEECDDGNNEPGDGCSPICTLEMGNTVGPGGGGVGGFGGSTTTMVGGAGGIGGAGGAGGIGGAGGATGGAGGTGGN
jgi:cysteine-rich repeat protein